MGAEILYKAKVTLVRKGYGDLLLTDKALRFEVPITFLDSVSENNVLIPFESILSVGTYTYLSGGGLKIDLKNGKQYKMAFNNRKKFNFFYEYLSNIDFSTIKGYDNTTCAFCGTPFQGEYCTKCGQKRVEIAQEKEPIPEQTHRCWNCGAEFETKVDFCSECGEKQDVNKLLVRIGTEMSKKYLYNICPKCGSRNIKLYRKGYDYKIGFWGAIFGVRGAGYAGGFDANKTCCRCMDCGKDWETNYDYRLVNK
jgi:DNA-directed RNA polymerase subunit RPC12/RpoP